MKKTAYQHRVTVAGPEAHISDANLEAATRAQTLVALGLTQLTEGETHNVY